MTLCLCGKKNLATKARRHKISLRIFSIVYCLLFTVVLISCGENKKEEKNISAKEDSLIYYCPMHPDVVSSKPGKCPHAECKGMELVLKTSDTLEKVLKPVNSSVPASIKTIKPVFKKISSQVEANGYFDFDTRTMNNISSLYSGRIEKLYVKYIYQQVHKGEKLLEIYSPELVTAQQNFLYVLKNDSAEKNLINAAKQKMILLGFPNELISELENIKKVMTTIPVFSNYEGHIHPMKNMSVAEMNPMTIGSMMGKKDFQFNKELNVKEGQYVMMGETIFNIVDAHHLAAMLQIKPEDAAKIKIGDEVEISTEDNPMTMKGKIDFIEPMLLQDAKTMMARVYIDNSEHNHKVGSLLKAKIKTGEAEALWIPVSALVDLGKEKIVWQKKDGNFIAKKVETGMIANGMIEISDGLTEENEIALEAHYLTDSEGFIKENSNEK
ncbi:MAG: efflux RND transporter periplasmic adaptor subunit [Bacteroidetes bacterium]|nr:efflux RND transporter periplasmic adaptor subunit [Bacteroidota bacterium]